MKLIIGLGNSGEKYTKTRHNLGFMVMDALARKLALYNVQFALKKNFNAEILKRRIFGEEVILSKPLTFMNASGLAVAKIVNFYHFRPADVWVVHDDVDLPLGKIKIRLGGAAGGHRGVESIIKQLDTDKFWRFRLGIGHPGRGADGLVEKYVLREFETKERSVVKSMIKKGVDAIKIAVNDGLETAMNRFNS